IKVAMKLRPKHFAPLAPQAGEVRTGLSMGEHQALTTHDWGVTRHEQDEIAMNSHKNMAAAYEEGFFNDLMTPFRGLDRDNNMRPGSDLESLGKLRIAFGKQLGEEATMTAGNSTPMTDGAAAALLSSEDWAQKNNLPILAEFVDFEVAAVDFVNGQDGLLMAPTYAIPRILDRHGLGLEDIDFFEIHEAFAGTVAATMKALADEDYNKNVLGRDKALGQIDPTKLNIKGSSLAAGHPFAATGPRIVASLSKMLHEKGPGSLGLISVCAAGGQGAVALLRGR
ncbi:MAG: acetyl-CoA C-acyltransferase, partial [Yaniella sp.]|nr:acetyl-CoA C-acyltransferase [Yaniella sp.]